MRKLLIVSLFVLFLAACGGENEEKEKSTASDNTIEEASTETQETEEASTDESEVAEGDVIENEMGTFNITKKQKDLEDVHENGPMKLTITGIQLGELEPSADYIDMFDGKEKLTTVTVGMTAENTSEDTVSFYPDQAVLTTNAGDQVDADLFLSGDVGGDFFGKVKKEGEVIFLLDTPVEEIESGKLIINGSHDENLDRLGEDMQIELEF